MDEAKPVSPSPTLEIDERGIGWIIFDDPDRKLNVLTEAVMTRLADVVEETRRAAESGRVKVVVVRSGKPDSCIAGADVDAIASIEDPAEAERAIRRGQEIFLAVERLPIPTVAAIHGVCVGGGTELALSCRHRVLSDSPKTRIGLPEVQLGILPAWGGTTRLPRLVGLPAALDLLLTGKLIDARKARRIGFAGEILPAEQFSQRVAAFALRALDLSPGASRPRKGVLARLRDNTAPGRFAVLAAARKRVLSTTGGHYPAPLKILEVLRARMGGSVAKSLEAEAHAAAELMVGSASKNLVHVFHLREAARKGAAVDDARAIEVARPGRDRGGRDGRRDRPTRRRPRDPRADEGHPPRRREQRPQARALRLRQGGREAQAHGARGRAAHGADRGRARLRRLRRGRRRGGGGGRAARREARRARGDGGRGHGRVHPRHEHERPVRGRDGGGAASPGAVLRHALLQPGAPHAPGRGGARSGHLGRHGRHDLRPLAPARKGARGRSGRPRLPGQPDPHALPERGRLAARRGRSGRGDRPGRARLRHADGTPAPHRRGGDRRVGARGRHHAPRAGRPPGARPAAGGAGRQRTSGAQGRWGLLHVRGRKGEGRGHQRLRSARPPRRGGPGRPGGDPAPPGAPDDQRGGARPRGGPGRNGGGGRPRR